MESLMKLIEESRSQLHHLASLYGIGNDLVIKKSQELDVLLNIYNSKVYKEKDVKMVKTGII